MRIDDMIHDKVRDALRNNGILNPDDYDIGIIAAPRLMDPLDASRPKEEQMLYGALVFLAAPIPARPFDRVEQMFQLPEPYGPQVMYDRAVKGALAKIDAELEQCKTLGPSHDNISAAGLIIP